jgi:hypothetical protein
MKLAWICYEYDDDFPDGYDSTRAIIIFDEPSKWKYAKIIQIVYAEIVS